MGQGVIRSSKAFYRRSIIKRYKLLQVLLDDDLLQKSTC